MDRAKLLSVVIGISFLSLPYLTGGWGCGSSASRAATSTISVTGSVSGVTASSASLSALGVKTKRALAEAAVANDSCTLSDSSGTEVGTATTDAAGTYTMSVETSVLNPDGAASVTVQLILNCASGYASFCEATVTAETTTITCSADPESTLAAQALLKKLKDLGCTGWNLSSCTVGFDPFCFAQMEAKKWELADVTGSGVSEDLGAMKDMMLSQLAAGDYGAYGNPGDMMQAFMAGDVDDSLEATAAANAATNTGTSADDYLEGLTGGLAGIGGFLSKMTDTFTGGSVGAGVTSLTTKGVVDATADSLCGTALADPDALAAIMRTLLAGEFDDVTAYDVNAAGKLKDLLASFTDRSGLNGAAMSGLLDACIDSADFTNCDPAIMKDFLDHPPTGGEGFDFRGWARAGMGCCLGSTTCDPTNCSGWSAAQTEGGADLETICSNPTDCAAIFENNGGTIDYAACLADPSACQDDIRPGCATNADCPSGATCDTTNHVCSGTFTGSGSTFAGSYSISKTGSCSPSFRSSTTLASGGSGMFAGPITNDGNLTIQFGNITGSSCSAAIVGSQGGTCSSCSVSGSGAVGTVFTPTCGVCNLTIGKTAN